MRIEKRTFAVLAGAVMIWFGVRMLLHGAGIIVLILSPVLIFVGMKLITAGLTMP